MAKKISEASDSIKSQKKKGNNGISFDFGDAKYKSIKEYDSIQKITSDEEKDGWLRRPIMYRKIELNNRYKDNLEQFGKDFVKAFMDNFSKVLFYLLPVFALLLKLLYVRKDYFYSEHLVFSIYYYN